MGHVARHGDLRTGEDRITADDCRTPQAQPELRAVAGWASNGLAVLLREVTAAGTRDLHFAEAAGFEPAEPLAELIRLATGPRQPLEYASNVGAAGFGPASSRV